VGEQHCRRLFVKVCPILGARGYREYADAVGEGQAQGDGVVGLRNARVMGKFWN
jgi:hypothetical protein